MSEAPRQGWYHVTGNTYGTWLPGDPRGYRTRHHRIHVEGDYKSPPPDGMYDALHTHARSLLAKDAVIFDRDQRRAVCDAVAQRLSERGVAVAVMSVGGCHFHLLMRIVDRQLAAAGLVAENALRDGRDPVPRHVVGVARKHASHALRERGLKAVNGRLWGKRPKFIPVENERHFLWLRDHYIPDHAAQGAAISRSS